MSRLPTDSATRSNNKLDRQRVREEMFNATRPILFAAASLITAAAPASAQLNHFRIDASGIADRTAPTITPDALGDQAVTPISGGSGIGNSMGAFDGLTNFDANTPRIGGDSPMNGSARVAVAPTPTAAAMGMIGLAAVGVPTLTRRRVD
jgi:hypothetical protein